MWDLEKQVSFRWTFTVHGLSLTFICLKFLDHKGTGSPASFQSIDRLCVRVCLLIHTPCVLVIVLMTRCASSKLAPGVQAVVYEKAAPVCFPVPFSCLFVLSQPPTVSKWMCWSRPAALLSGGCDMEGTFEAGVGMWRELVSRLSMRNARSGHWVFSFLAILSDYLYFL